MTIKPSDLSSKIAIPAGISPVNDNSEYPTHYSDFGFGGLRTVDNVTERDAIPSLRRVRGMQVYVVNEKKYYRLEDGIANTNWTEFSLERGGHVIEREDGTDLPQRGKLQFIGAGTITDGGSTTDRTIVSLDGTKLLERQFVAADWTTTDAPAGSIVLNINHNLNTGNIIVEWYENTSQGAVFVPWESRDNNNIRGCIPAGSGFTGLARIASSSILTQEQGSGVRGFETSFNSLTSGNDASWIETGTDTGIFELDISHGLNSTVVDYLLYLDNRCPVLICPTAITTTRITFQVPQATVFGGRIFVSKIGE